MTLLAVPVFVESVEGAVSDAALAGELGADVVEYRLDRMDGRADEVRALVGRSPLPCIVTCRPVWEGGEFEGDEDERVGLIVAGAEAGARYVDFELAAWQKGAAGGEGRGCRERIAAVVSADETDHTKAGLILSSHDFDTRPADLLRRVHAMAEEPLCRVVKVAWRARSLRDNLEAFDVIAGRHKPTIALCMGEFGLASRVLAGKFGAFLTFASLRDESATAPGQVDIAAMKGLYRWDAIGAATSVYGVIGWPVGHSMSPAVHNAGFDAIGFDGVYLPMPIPPEYEHLKATLIAWTEHEALGFGGASVTIPHKANLLRFAAERQGQGESSVKVEELAERIGAANTLAVGEGGRLGVSNTDYGAALDAACGGLGIEREGLSERSVGVIGAGGAAAAVVAGFAAYGATMVVYNRTIERAQELAAKFNEQSGKGGKSGKADEGSGGKVVAARLEKLPKTCCDVLINCTPIGMHPEVDKTPVEAWPEGLGGNGLVFDTIYNPIETRLLREAGERGLKTVNGVEMFVRQAGAQFELWTGRDAPLDVFERVVRERLGY